VNHSGLSRLIGIQFVISKYLLRFLDISFISCGVKDVSHVFSIKFKLDILFNDISSDLVSKVENLYSYQYHFSTTHFLSGDSTNSHTSQNLTDSNKVSSQVTLSTETFSFIDSKTFLSHSDFDQESNFSNTALISLIQFDSDGIELLTSLIEDSF
jgi:hypothetical protein